MSLPIGSRQTPPGLDGTWSVWSKSAETPGAYFMVPLDQTARDTGIKYAVVKAKQERTKARPTLTVIRTDPHHPTQENS